MVLFRAFHNLTTLESRKGKWEREVSASVQTFAEEKIMNSMIILL